MRVPNFVLKSVAVIGEAVSQEPLADIVTEWGTGFVVGVRSTVAHAYSFHYLVTAKHVVEPRLKQPLIFIVNDKSGRLARLPMLGHRWYFHPTDKSTDVAIHPLEWVTNHFDVIPVCSQLLADQVEMARHDIGIGDDVYLPGLFGAIAGFKGFHPILRHGLIAMLPVEQIQTPAGFTDVYLMEARSIGGLSGSPVFVRPTVNYRPSSDALWLDGLARYHRVIGMARSHWDIPEDKRNSYHAVNDEDHGVNMGIAIVTPAYKIIETLNHPDLARARANADARLLANISPTFDRSLLDQVGHSEEECGCRGPR